jgi:hypothetical protein
MNPDTWKLIASIGGVLITVVTGPIIWAIRAESGRIRAETNLKLIEMEGRLKLEMAVIGKDMLEMEKRLNERIDTRLVHR